MQVQNKVPANLQKKRQRDARIAKANEEQCKQNEKKLQESNQYALAQGKKHWENYMKTQQDEINEKREAFKRQEFYVPSESKFLLVVRIKGINKVAPKPKKIMQLLRLTQIGTAVFIKNNKATMNMIRVIEPWVTYGTPTRKTIKQMVYKRGYGKINRQRIPLSSNEVVEQGLGQYNIKCVEDLIHELWTFGNNFKEVSNFLWPFHLNSPKGGYKSKRHQYLQGGDQGPRDEEINQLVQRML